MSMIFFLLNIVVVVLYDQIKRAHELHSFTEETSQEKKKRIYTSIINGINARYNFDFLF